MKALTLILTFCIFVSFSQAKPTLVTRAQVSESFRLNQTQRRNETRLSNSCDYMVTIVTSCDSPPFTTDQISILFGDADGYKGIMVVHWSFGFQLYDFGLQQFWSSKYPNCYNQVYVPRLDDPDVGTFEQCSMDEFEIMGPCINEICTLELFRSGSDGWIPETVTASDYNNPPVTFLFDVLIPEDGSYGFDNCN